MNIQEIANLIDNNKEMDIPLDVPYADIKAANMLTRKFNDCKYPHPLAKEDEANYGYIGLIRLRDIKYTHEYVKSCRQHIVDLAKAQPTKLLQIATVYNYIVSNFNINLEYKQAFQNYYKLSKDIFTKSDEEIREYFRLCRPYLHPFEEVEINGRKCVVCSRVDLYESKKSIEGIITEEFELLLKKVCPDISMNYSFCKLRDSSDIYGIYSINVSDDKEVERRTLFAPALDIREKQMTGHTDMSHFGFLSSDKRSEIDSINEAFRDHEAISVEERTATFEAISNINVSE